MPAFILALIALVSAYAQSGQPATLPPSSQEEVSVRGDAISELAKNLNPESSQAQGQSEEENPAVTGESIDTTQVSAYNAKSEKEMPTEIPQVAVDNSVALVPSENGGTETGNESEAEEQVETEVNTSADFGQDVANSQPAAASSDGQSFGQSTSDAAPNNSRRP